MTTIRRTALLLLLLMLLALGCQTPGAPQMTYTVSPCQEGIAPGDLASWAKVEAHTEGGKILLQQNLDYVCCAKVELRLERQGSLLKVTETNVGEMCRCKCGYVIAAEITGLPRGRYTLQVWGVAFEDQQPELLGETAINL